MVRFFFASFVLVSRHHFRATAKGDYDVSLDWRVLEAWTFPNNVE